MTIKRYELDYFQLEEQRCMYSKKGQLKRLEETYIVKAYGIKDKNTPAFWDKAFKRQKRNYGGMYADKEKIILNKLGNRKCKLLGIGFGVGQLESKLPRSIDFFGIDISKYAIKRAKKKIKGTFKKASILKIPFKNKTFDSVLLVEIMEHIVPSKTFKALAEAKRVLKDGGKLILSVPLNEPLEEIIKEGKNPSGHVRIYTPDLIKAELIIAGFTVKKEEQLYAFENLYWFKKLFQKTILKNRWRANSIIIFAEKSS